MRKLLGMGAALALATAANASMILSSNATVIDIFDGMITTGSTPLTATVGTHNLLAGTDGWEGTKTGGSGSVLNLVADAGGGNSGALYSYGSSGSSDRALGSIASGSTIPAFGLEIVNNTGVAISSLAIEFDREQWRSSTSTTNVIPFASALSGGSATSTNYLTDASLVANTAFDLVGEPFVTTNGALDGNVHSVHISGTLTVSIPNGSSVYIRWTDTNDIGNDAGLAVDNFAVTPTLVPEPASLALLALGGLFFRRR